MKSRTDYIQGIGFVYYDEKGHRYVFDDKREMDQFINELKEKKKKDLEKEEKKRKLFFQPQIELLHRKGIGK
jgi:predicted N-acyltransferase